MDKKTRKNQTNLQVNWPSEDEYWTIKDLRKRNMHFNAEITLRVRLTNAIKKTNTVAVIGDKMNPHGRPEMVCAVRQNDGSVKPSVIQAAKDAGIRVNESLSVVVTEVKKSTDTAPQTDNATQTAVNLNPAKPVTA